MSNPPAPATANHPRIPREGAFRVRVRYAECDPMGVAHHASYVTWMEIARTELLRSGEMSYARLEETGVLLVVAKLDVRYRRPVRYDDVIEVRVRTAEASRVKIDHEYELVVVERLGNPCDETVAAGRTTLACVDRQGKIAPLPSFLTDR